MKPVILLAILVSLAACQQANVPDNGDASQAATSNPPPEEGPRAACPEGTEMQGGPGEFQEWCQKPDGTLQGRYTIWHKNRHRAAEGEYHKNLKQGEWVYWHPNGQKASLGKYENGKRQDTWSYWHENGRLAETGSYQNGLEHGKWTFYNENGDKTAENQYNNGIQLHR